MGKKRFTIEYVKEFVKNKGFCLSEKYFNSNCALTWKCLCGNVWRATFADIKRKGSWCRECAKRDREKTVLEKYGVKNVSQNYNIHQKQTASMNDIFTLYHWKTNEKVVCRGNFERLVIEYLNNNKIDFDWQIPFSMPNDLKYTIDLYLKKEDKWVEIKGKFWNNAKEKWDWFHKKYPNSELWDMKKLRNMKILPKSFYYHKNKEVYIQ